MNVPIQTNSAKPPHPDPAPTIPLQVDSCAILLSDMDRYSTGNLVMSLTQCVMSNADGKVGELLTDVTGRWFVRIAHSLYELPVSDIFAAVHSAHLERIADADVAADIEGKS